MYFPLLAQTGCKELPGYGSTGQSSRGIMHLLRTSKQYLILDFKRLGYM